MTRNRTLLAEKTIRRYSYFVIWFCLLGVVGVHIPRWLGTDWTLYKNYGSWATIFIHFYEVPIIFLNLYVSYYGLKRFTWDRRAHYVSIRHSLFAVNTVFITIECIQAFFAFTGNAPNWEKISYAAIIILMFAAICYLLYLMRLLNSYETPNGFQQDARGFYHPKTEEELVELVKMANRRIIQIRCRGSAHSLSHAIYAGPQHEPNKVSVKDPTPSKHMNVSLDRYNGFRWLDDKLGLVEVDAGIHLGVDPNDEQRRSTVKNSLLYQAADRGFTLNDLGGITHQTISGFLMTGCSGGSLRHSIAQNIEEFSIIDGQGKLEWFRKGEVNFNALLCSLGVQGIISKVRLRLQPMYIIVGEERTVPLPTNFVDLFSAQPGGLEAFLRKNDYARMLWWPQPGVERVVVWKANRWLPVPAGFKPKPYRQLSDNRLGSLIEQTFGSLAFTVLGNRNFFRVLKKTALILKAFSDSMYQAFGPSFMSWLFTSAVTLAVIPLTVFLVLPVLYVFKAMRKNNGPLLATQLVKWVQPLTKPGKVKYFEDYPAGSLPLDNEINDTIVSTEFTEFWVPIAEADRAIRVFHNLYTANGWASTGYYATEIYSAPRSELWMSPAYGTDVVRIDLFWFSHNEGDPSAQAGFFNQFWDAMRAQGIPFRLHWAKFLPGYPDPADPVKNYRDWAGYFESQYPMWNDFLLLRKQRDPRNIFLTDYWALHLLGR